MPCHGIVVDMLHCCQERRTAFGFQRFSNISLMLKAPFKVYKKVIQQDLHTPANIALYAHLLHTVSRLNALHENMAVVNSEHTCTTFVVYSTAVNIQQTQYMCVHCSFIARSDVLGGWMVFKLLQWAISGTANWIRNRVTSETGGAVVEDKKKGLSENSTAACTSTEFYMTPRPLQAFCVSL